MQPLLMINLLSQSTKDSGMLLLTHTQEWGMSHEFFSIEEKKFMRLLKTISFLLFISLS